MALPTQDFVASRQTTKTRDDMSPSEYRKQFLKIFHNVGRHHSRYERFADFLELATCAVRKTTVPPGPESDTFEARYMKVVARYPADDIRTMPKLLAFAIRSDARCCAVFRGDCGLDCRH